MSRGSHSPENMDDTVPEIRGERLLCADLRHAWRSVGDTVLLEKKGQVKVFSRTLECPRCETCRVDTYQMVGHSVLHVGTRYQYPRWYHIKGGLKLDQARYLIFKNARMVKPVREEST